MADKTPVRYAYDGSSLTGIAEYATSDTVGVGFGGTGATSLTDNGVLIGNATSAIQVTNALTTNGQIVIGGTSGPAVANVTGTTNEVEITSGDGSITIGLPSTVSGLTNVSATNLTGTLATAAQANITSVGTLTSLNSSGDVSFDGGAFVFNESGADKDFRVEGDTDANLLIADASTDRIGIGTATPSHLLDVEGVANVATCIITPKICVPTAGFNSGYALPGADGSAGQIMCTDGSGALAFATAAAGFVSTDAHTWTADQTFNDNVKVTLGTGGDADIYYDGTNLVINPVVAGTGHLQVDSTRQIMAEFTSTTVNAFVAITAGSEAVGDGGALGFTVDKGAAIGSASMIGYIQGKITQATPSALKGDLQFFTNSGDSVSERMRVLGAGGITFNGDTGTANALDDYEEGTWTGAFTLGSGSAGLNAAYNTGAYTKVGRLVTITGAFMVGSVSSPGGGIVVTGLPFSSGGAGDDYEFRAAGGISNWYTTGTINSLNMFMSAASNYAYIQSDATNNEGDHLQVNTEFRFSMTYTTS